ncbi:hypothetical protein Cgig2_025113 [Carnegiea gigantea]|uniref:Uncharacterized protein n=1 Tax=Carnegiea gigantea TaxID=171969 RepID=A0A9Q1JL84_9CARY|nr:hypothetical protein Cgig2_025113 [Carnegiea gigantea]
MHFEKVDSAKVLEEEISIDSFTWSGLLTTFSHKSPTKESSIKEEVNFIPKRIEKRKFGAVNSAAKSVKLNCAIFCAGGLKFDSESNFIKWEVRSEALAPYQAHLVDITKNFAHITYTYLLFEDNQFVDALMTLASIFNISNNIHSMSLTIEKRNKLAHFYIMEGSNIDLTLSTSI